MGRATARPDVPGRTVSCIRSCSCRWPANTVCTFDFGCGSANTSCRERCSRGCGLRPGTNPPPTRPSFSRPSRARYRSATERTEKQDAALGVRQLVDMACKALSPAVNDPYTAVQSIDHLAVIFCALAGRPLGDDVAADPTGRGVVVVPGAGVLGDDRLRRAASSVATAALNRRCRWRCSGCCSNAPPYWPTIRPDGPRSASRRTSF